ncbi:hypothetical protein CHARACLAT_006175 [Characodon lateralis]|uniref:Uncharacterized protein n=1 Tax=Characodon lateralis TaxID=208331 RepID=A0ABU7CKW3_9TELE|nr:hypothetical protein [Characodon lateralis]
MSHASYPLFRKTRTQQPTLPLSLRLYSLHILVKRRRGRFAELSAAASPQRKAFGANRSSTGAGPQAHRLSPAAFARRQRTDSNNFYYSNRNPPVGPKIRPVHKA